MSTSQQPDLATLVNQAAPRRGGKLRIALIALAVVGLGGLGWYFFAPKPAKKDAAPTFESQNLAKGDISLTITATGNLAPTNEVTVGSELSGKTLEVYVDVNDLVVKDQPLAKLDTTVVVQRIESSQASLRSAQARVAQAKATVKEAEANLRRQQELRRLSDGRLPSLADMESAEASAERARADLLVAEASVGQAEATLRINESDLDKSIIRSPIDGIVLKRNVEPGQTVAASFTAPELFVIAESLENMELRVTVAEADIARLAKGQPASFTVDAWPGRRYQAKVTRVAYGSTVANNVVTYETELEVSNAELDLRPGMTATTEIYVAEAKNVWVVPNAALRFDPASATAAKPQEQRTLMQNLTPMPRFRFNRGGGRGGNGPAMPVISKIYTLQDGKPVEIQVQVGLNDGNRTEVISDELKEGMPIILRVQ